MTRGASVGRATRFHPAAALPTTWLFEPILRAFIITSIDTAPVPGFFAALEEVLVHPKAHDRMRLLIDNSRIPAPTPEVIREVLTRLTPYADRLAGTTVVLVVPGEHDHGIGRLTTLMLAGKVDLEVFNDMGAAVLSLTMDDGD